MQAASQRGRHRQAEAIGAGLSSAQECGFFRDSDAAGSLAGLYQWVWWGTHSRASGTRVTVNAEHLQCLGRWRHLTSPVLQTLLFPQFYL